MKILFSSFVIILIALIAFTGSYNLFAQDASAGYNEKSYFIERMLECDGPGQLKYDDGTFENGYGWNAAVVTEGRIVMLFTPPSYPWQFNTICFPFTQNNSSSLNFDVVIYDDDGPSGTPGTFIAAVTNLNAAGIPAWPTLAWYDFDISSVPPLNDGSWFIGIRWNNVPAYPGTFVGADQSPSTPLQPAFGWNNSSGVWNAQQNSFPDYKAMGIRTLGASTTGPGPATDPSPANNATGVTSTGLMLSWTNPAGATSNEVFFGADPGSLTSIHSGSLVSSVNAPSPLMYNTRYYWKVNETDGSGTTGGSIWSFRTEYSPGTILIEPFDNMNCWTPIGPLGMTNWTANNSANAGGTAPELRLNWSPEFNGLSKLLSCDLISTAGNPHKLSFKHMCDNYDDDPSPELGVAISYDNGATTTTLWSFTPPTGGINVGPEDIEVPFTPTANNFKLVFFNNGNSFNINYWYVDNVLLEDVVPVELTSFAASVVDGIVSLNWTTATETNNYGFEVERKSAAQEFTKVGFVGGYGTTTETINYSYIDNSVTSGSYIYRLKQVDFDGTFEYSSEVEVELAPVTYSLGQNYPNPFNPSTKISFGLAADSKVTLKIFNVLGQEVTTLVNGSLNAGIHNIDFSASQLNSGVYFYQIEAEGIDGSRFSEVKKMMLTK